MPSNKFSIKTLSKSALRRHKESSRKPVVEPRFDEYNSPVLKDIVERTTAELTELRAQYKYTWLELLYARKKEPVRNVLDWLALDIKVTEEERTSAAFEYSAYAEMYAECPVYCAEETSTKGSKRDSTCWNYSPKKGKKKTSDVSSKRRRALAESVRLTL